MLANLKEGCRSQLPPPPYKYAHAMDNSTYKFDPLLKTTANIDMDSHIECIYGYNTVH